MASDRLKLIKHVEGSSKTFLSNRYVFKASYERLQSVLERLNHSQERPTSACVCVCVCVRGVGWEWKTKGSPVGGRHDATNEVLIKRESFRVSHPMLRYSC